MADEFPMKYKNAEEIKRLLASISVIRAACELDLLVFLCRHPRTLLTNEQLAAFVGYDTNKVAKAVDAFIDAGLLERTQNPSHAARMYLLVLNGPQGGALIELRQLVSTRQGRQNVLRLLDSQQSQTKSQSAPVDIAEGRANRQLYATA